MPRTCAHIYPLLGERRIGSLQKSDIKSLVATKARELAPSTVETVVAVLRAMLASAVEDGVIPVNPAARVQLPEVTPRVLMPLGPAQGPGARRRGQSALSGRRGPRRIQVLEQAQAGEMWRSRSQLPGPVKSHQPSHPLLPSAATRVPSLATPPSQRPWTPTGTCSRTPRTSGVGPLTRLWLQLWRNRALSGASDG
jgi:hypothetical protein